MLSRTADNLFWMARYIERTENTARLLDVNLTTSLLPQTAEEAERGWRALLGISELQGMFDDQYATLAPRSVLDFMVRDGGNPSSIYSCLQAARANARAVRGTLTTEVWETINDTWLELQRRLADGDLESNPKQLFEWVKFRSHLSRGVTIGTMLQDEAFHFARLGTFLERADNTARLLDVKFHGTPTTFDGLGAAPAMPSAEQRDFYYWAAILRSVSGFEVYRKVYRDVITPPRVAELLILREDMPRSLAACIKEVCRILELVRNSRSRETERRAGLLGAELNFGRIDDILHQGLHHYLTAFLERINDLAGRVSHDFLVPLAVE